MIERLKRRQRGVSLLYSLFWLCPQDRKDKREYDFRSVAPIC